MSDQTNHAAEHADFERTDIGAKGVIYFLIGLALATLLVGLLMSGLYSLFRDRANAQQPMISPLATAPPVLKTKPEYDNYVQHSFPDPRLENDERNQLNQVRLREDEILSSYSWADENAGTVRIPIDRAMELVAERGLPVKPADAAATTPAAAKPAAKKENKP